MARPNKNQKKLKHPKKLKQRKKEKKQKKNKIKEAKQKDRCSKMHRKFVEGDRQREKRISNSKTEVEMYFSVACHCQVMGAYLHLAEVQWVKTGVPGVKPL